MRILIPVHSFEPGGSERVALRLARAWRSLKHDVDIVIGRDEGPRPAFTDGMAFDVLQRGALSTAPFETAWMIAKLPGRIRATQPDVIFCPGNSYAVVAVAMKLLLGAACPPILLKISNDLDRPDMNRVEQFFYRLWCRAQGRTIDRFSALCAAMSVPARAALGVSNDKMVTVDDPVLLHAEGEALGAARREVRPRHRGRRFLAVGRLAPQKNFPLLLRAFARIAEPDDRLTILGEGPDRGKLEQLAARLGVQDQVLMPGHVGSTQEWLVGCDLFVLSSDYEGLPAVVVEALAAGVPIVTTDCSASMQGLLDHGRLGRLVPLRDEAALASAMAAPLAADPRRSADMAFRFTVDQGAPAFIHAFENMLASRHVDQTARAPAHHLGNSNVSH
jgi:glycosyltransferase involved in cell wall biosynthesis